MRCAALIAHPSTPCEFIRSFTVDMQRLQTGALRLTYRLEGDLERLNVPAPRQPARADELWRHTCFEAFLSSTDAPGYAELNFAPSGEWAAYSFDDYRSGMKAIEQITTPSIRCTRASQLLQLDVELEPAAQWGGAAQARELRVALTAVLEDTHGRISYWALAHPGARPDFHNPA